MNNLTPKRAYLFDVDGVLTNPEAKKIEQKEIFDELIKRLQEGEPIGLNTGRSLEFMILEVLQPLESKITEKVLLKNVFAIGEKGSAWITYDSHGVRTVRVDKLTSVPQAVQDEVKVLLEKPIYKNVMFYDETKLTMVSVELKHGKSIVEFQNPQKELTQELQILLMRHGLQSQLKIDPTRIATDIENVHVGKALGARRFVEILTERGILPEEYIGFGDSISDYDMLTELEKLQKKVSFVYVGDKTDLQGKDATNVIFTKKLLDHGTLEYLQSST